MKMNKVAIKVTVAALALSSVVGVATINMPTSKANNVGVEYDVDMYGDLMITDTLKNYCQNASNMTEEDFVNTFSSDAYINEFNELFASRVTRGGGHSALAQQLGGLTAGEKDDLIDEIEDSVPDFIKDQINKEDNNKLKDMIRAVIDWLIDDATIDLLVEKLCQLTGIDESIIRPAVELVIGLVEKAVENYIN